MTTEQLSDLPVIAMNANIVTIDKRLVCDKLSSGPASSTDDYAFTLGRLTGFFLKEFNLYFNFMFCLVVSCAAI